MTDAGKLQPWQRAVWRFLESLPPIPEGGARRWYTNRKGQLDYIDYTAGTITSDGNEQE